MAFNESKAKQDFKHFMSLMDAQIEWLREQALIYAIAPLDFNINNLDELEYLFDGMSEGVDKEGVTSLVLIFARYLGETVRRTYGGEWELCLEKDNVYFNTPVIVGHSPVDGLMFSPIFTMRGYALRRKKGALALAVGSDVNPKALNLDHLTEEENRPD